MQINMIVMEQDIRWIQRLDSYKKACTRVLEITEGEICPALLSELEKEGLIQRFEYTFELAWKVLQDYLHYRGFEFQPGPNSTLQTAFENGLINNHDGWRRMAKARNTTAHTYNEGEAGEIVEKIFNEYSPLLSSLLDELLKCKEMALEKDRF